MHDRGHIVQQRLSLYIYSWSCPYVHNNHTNVWTLIQCNLQFHWYFSTLNSEVFWKCKISREIIVIVHVWSAKFHVKGLWEITCFIVLLLLFLFVCLFVVSSFSSTSSSSSCTLRSQKAFAHKNLQALSFPLLTPPWPWIKSRSQK